MQKPWPRRIPELNSTVAPTPRGLCLAGARARPVLSLKPNNGGIEQFQPRSDLPLPLRARPSEPCLHRQPIPGSAPPSGVWQTPLVVAVRGMASPSLVKGHNVVSTASCAPWKREVVRPPRPRAFVCRTGQPHQDPGHGRRRSFGPSLQPLGKLLQPRNPLRPNVPTTAQADR